MIIRFRTNIDKYNFNLNIFPSIFPYPPQKGDFIQVRDDFKQYFSSRQLPMRLEVVSVTWNQVSSSDETEVTCELWYNKTDYEFAKLGGIELL